MAEQTPARSATQWEGSLRWLIVPAVALPVALFAAYQYLVPALGGAAANRVPLQAVEFIGNETMKSLDSGVLSPTGLPQARRDRLVSRFVRLRFPGGADPDAYTILFRSSEALGPNALALPSGTIVVTDALVALTETDEGLLAVLAHEAGHVEHRHGLRHMFQSSAVTLALAWLLGDVGSLAAAAPAALLQAKYSRDLERQADEYAVAVLDSNGIPREHFARMLRDLQSAAEAKGGAGGVLGYLSSHPVTGERIDSLGID